MKRLAVYGQKGGAISGMKPYKTWAALLLTLVLLWTGLILPAGAAQAEAEGDPSPFTDVTEETQGFQAILYSARRGILSGVGGGRFCPDEPAAWSAAIAVLGRLFGVDSAQETAEAAWYAPYYRWARYTGVQSQAVVWSEDISGMELLDLTRRCFSAFDLEPPSALETAQVDSTPVTRGELAQLAELVDRSLTTLSQARGGPAALSFQENAGIPLQRGEARSFRLCVAPAGMWEADDLTISLSGRADLLSARITAEGGALFLTVEAGAYGSDAIPAESTAQVTVTVSGNGGAAAVLQLQLLPYVEEADVPGAGA